FGFPVAYWFKNQLGPFLSSLWSGARIVREGLVREAYVRRLLEEHRRGLVDHHVRLWMLLNVELWYRIYIDEEPWQAVADDLALRLTAVRAHPALTHAAGAAAS
ncbi:MAG TPA: asparagine synthase-related protein, partial [Gemmatimonadales bacterium]|nr:asparagine synthase-related protein [Gemmatimonadales bacterium]